MPSDDWSSKERFPYEVDYNDHFETPLIAYKDILPLLDLVSPAASEHKSCRSDHVLYDPYYCNGRTKTLLRQLGFNNIRHEERDFYKDIKKGSIPDHHALITNPPYSADHKVKCIDFAIRGLRNNSNGDKKCQRRPFFLLMPNYIATKEYYRRACVDEVSI